MEAQRPYGRISSEELPCNRRLLGNPMQAAPARKPHAIKPERRIKQLEKEVVKLSELVAKSAEKVNKLKLENERLKKRLAKRLLE